MPQRMTTLVLAILGTIAVAFASWKLHVARDGVIQEAVTIGHIPATVYRMPGTEKSPVVVIAHGFAGSEPLMVSFAYTIARNGLTAITFDYAGHGRNPKPLSGNITREDGATRTLVVETEEVLAYARTIGDGRVALLGHSMASDIIVRTAAQNPDVAATIAISMFSPAVTRDTPKNLLIVVGDWEGMLKTEALRVTSLVSAPEEAKPGVTYGDIAKGTARRAYFSSYAEHVGVLYRPETLHRIAALARSDVRPEVRKQNRSRRARHLDRPSLHRHRAARKAADRVPADRIADTRRRRFAVEGSLAPDRPAGNSYAAHPATSADAIPARPRRRLSRLPLRHVRPSHCRLPLVDGQRPS